jgi:phosphatidylinositol glycan class M
MIFWGILLRTILMIYGYFMDFYALKYTDIDYSVFTDASAFVLDGGSPYQRATYRYTPLLSWILVPNQYFLPFGKVLFSICDVLVGLMLEQMLLRRGISKK